MEKRIDTALQKGNMLYVTGERRVTRFSRRAKENVGASNIDAAAINGSFSHHPPLFSGCLYIHKYTQPTFICIFSLSLFGSLLVGYVDFHGYAYNAKAAIRPTYLRET